MYVIASVTIVAASRSPNQYDTNRINDKPIISPFDRNHFVWLRWDVFCWRSNGYIWNATDQNVIAFFRWIDVCIFIVCVFSFTHSAHDQRLCVFPLLSILSMNDNLRCLDQHTTTEASQAIETYISHFGDIVMEWVQWIYQKNINKTSTNVQSSTMITQRNVKQLKEMCIDLKFIFSQVMCVQITSNAPCRCVCDLLSETIK